MIYKLIKLCEIGKNEITLLDCFTLFSAGALPMYECYKF